MDRFFLINYFTSLWVLSPVRSKIDDDVNVYCILHTFTDNLFFIWSWFSLDNFSYLD